MKVVRMLVLTVLPVVWLSGCGTMENIADNRTVYGGVHGDLEDCAKNWKFWRDGGKGPPPYFGLIAAGVCIADLPLSAVTDTLTLPLTIPTSLNNKASPEIPGPEEVSKDNPDWTDWRNHKPLTYERIHGVGEPIPDPKLVQQ